MQSSASLLTDGFDDLLARLPASLDLEAVALGTKAIERKREIGTGADLLRLALVRGPCGLSLSQTGAWAALHGMGRLSDPAVKGRLDKAVGFLQAILEHQLAAISAGAALRCRSRGGRDGACARATAPASRDPAARARIGACMRCSIWAAAASRIWT